MVVGVHGFAEHGGRYRHVGEALASAGFSFCIPDLRGHGRTATEHDRGYVSSFSDFLVDLKHYISHLRTTYSPRALALLGHSMGGLIALYYAAMHGDVDAVITSGAATIVEVNVLQRLLLTLLAKTVPRFRLKLPINPKLLSHDENVVRRYAEDPLVVKRPAVKLVYELVEASRRFWRHVHGIRVPLLLLHGGDDRIVPPRASVEVYRKAGSSVKELKIYPHLYHEILNEPEWRSIVEDIAAWLKATVRPAH